MSAASTFPLSCQFRKRDIKRENTLKGGLVFDVSVFNIYNTSLLTTKLKLYRNDVIFKKSKSLFRTKSQFTCRSRSKT